VRHRVDGAAASESSTLWKEDAPTVQPGLRRGFVRPSEARVQPAHESGEEAARACTTAGPGLEKKHATRRISTQAKGEDAASRAAADNHVVVGWRLCRSGHARIVAAASLQGVFPKAATAKGRPTRDDSSAVRLTANARRPSSREHSTAVPVRAQSRKCRHW